MPTREQILKIAAGLPISNLQRYIKDSTITLDDLREINLPQDKLERLEQKLFAEEQQLWNVACNTGRITDFNRYLTAYPDGQFAEACRQALISGEEEFWNEIMESGSIPLMQQYLEVYEVMGGVHVYECQDMLNDPDWIQVKKNPNLANLKAYEDSHPESHKIEIAEMRAAITDDIDWYNALSEERIEAIERYLDLHPQGKFVEEAQQRIDAAKFHDMFIADMTSDINNKSAMEIKEAVNGNVVTWDEVMRAYGHERTLAIQNYIKQDDLILPVPPEKLQPNSTEVYFWGTPSSGKTCALGSLLSGAEQFYSLWAQDCQGNFFMTKLKNSFRPNEICTLPPSTQVDEIQEMIFTIEDEKHHPHRMTFIDLAGEIFRAIFFDLNKMFLSEQHQQTLNLVKGYLNDNRNPKIHFFVVEYGAEDKTWEGIYMKDYLSTCSRFIKDNKILKNSNGVYILVTKCDKIGCSDDEIVDQAELYVKDKLPAFYNNLDKSCQKFGISDFQVIPFSIGEVFANQLCNYDDSFIDDVIEVLLAKTRGIKKSKLDWLKQ